MNSNGYNQFVTNKPLDNNNNASSQSYSYPHLLPYGYGMPPPPPPPPPPSQPYGSPDGSSVYIQRAPIGITKHMEETTWSTNIFACGRDPKNCMYSDSFTLIVNLSLFQKTSFFYGFNDSIILRVHNLIFLSIFVFFSIVLRWIT